MAYMFLPAAFIYLLPAAIFFWLSKDFITSIAKKVAGGVPVWIKSSQNKVSEFVSKQRNKKASFEASAVEQPAYPMHTEASAVEQPVYPMHTEASYAPVPGVEMPVMAVPEAAASAISGNEMPEPANMGLVSGISASGQMTIDEAVVAPVTEPPPVAAPAMPMEAAAVAPQQEAPQLTPVAEPPPPATELPSEITPVAPPEGTPVTPPEAPPVAPMEATAVAPQQEAPQFTPVAEPPPEVTPVTSSMGVTPVWTTVNDGYMAEEKIEKAPVDLLGSVKRNFSSALGRAKGLLPSKKLTEKPADDYEELNNSYEAAGGFRSRAASRIDYRNDVDAGSVEEQVKRQFDNLDMITTSAIAIMLSDTKTKAASPYIKSLKKPDIRMILLKFCQDSFFATDIEQINKLFSKSYYRWKVTRYLGRVTVFVKRGIGDSLPRRSALRKARITKNRFINRICETINTFESVKYISALSGNEEISDSKRNYKLDHLSENYKDALVYLVDLLLTCTCIAKMLFVERMIKRMSPNSEFNKIITNMAQSISNHNLIISKSRPIYKQYYQAELGYLSGDDLLYGMAITIMVNRAKKTEIKNTDILHITREQDTRSFNQSMRKWLDDLSRYDAVDDIGTLILQKITLSIEGNYGLLTNALQELTNWENYYSQRVAYYKKERDRERYLKGDFEKEKEELVKVK